MADNNDNSTTLDAYERARQLSIIKNTRQVLIIDDQSTGRAILERIVLQIADNIKVNSFGDPIVAMTWLDDHDVDLIITDYRMPQMNGVEVIKVVRGKSHCKNVPIMMITVVSEKEVRYEALDAGVTAFLTRPIDQIECRTSCRNLLQLHEQHLIIQDKADWLARQVEVATEQIVQRERETIIRLAKAGEYRDEGTGNHVVRMAKYSRLIAEATGKFNLQQCDDLEYAAPMHDIGKIGIPDKVLLKPGKLDTDEWEIMKSHTTIGHGILANSQSKYMQIGAIIALNHHERFDGKGYPNGLKEIEIPLIARVVTIADVYDALVSARPYKLAWSDSDAVAYIEQQAGTQMDPDCVQAFFDCLDYIKTIKKEYSDESDS